MEIIDAGELLSGSVGRTVLVAHARTGLTRGLEPGETVLLEVGGDEYRVARVADIAFELDDTVYTLELGGRIPGDLARERAAGLDPVRHDLTLHEVVDLLHDLRDQGHQPPADRALAAVAGRRHVPGAATAGPPA